MSVVKPPVEKHVDVKTVSPHNLGDMHSLGAVDVPVE